MTTFRVGSFNEVIGEPEHDANSALAELDKGLRSLKIGEQCEAIIRFPKLFEKYPFPILINSSFLKLADTFRNGNNYIRQWVLHVCQESEKHLDKILNVDEFIRRVYSVIHSNDPIARALSLKTLGSVACVIPERQQVHHSIRNGLDSHDSVEVEAAIYAAMQFAAQSKSFALGMCSKISDMIQGLATPAHMKLQLIPILQYMHHDSSTATMVREVCTKLLPKYPSKDFVTITLNTLTKLSVATLVDIPVQVELLLKFLIEDSRWSVKREVLLGLQQLAAAGPHLWPNHCVAKAISVARVAKCRPVISLALNVFIVLTKSSVVCREFVDTDSALMQLCQETCYMNNFTIAVKSIQIITHMICFCFEEGLPVSDVEEYIDTVESLILLLVSTSCNSKDYNVWTMRSCLKCTVTLCKANRSLTSRFIELLVTQLSVTQGKCSADICEALAGIGELQPKVLEPYLPEVLQKLSDIENCNDPIDSVTKVLLCTLLLQCLRLQNWDISIQAAIESVLASTDTSSQFKVARACARYGHYKTCSSILIDLKDNVPSEYEYFWLEGLNKISLGEAELNRKEGTLVDKLRQAITLYCTGISSLKASMSSSNSLTFQCDYAKARCEFLICLSQTAVCCYSVFYSPPAAIANALSHATRDELQKCGHIINQLRKCSGEFRECANLYRKLYQSAFDADSCTLTNIKILEHSCMLMIYMIDSISISNYQGDEPKLDPRIKNSGLEIQMMAEACETASSYKPSLFRNPDSDSHPMTIKCVECLLKQIAILVKATFCLPRYFFQTLQSTSVKLSVTPQPRSNGEWVTLTSGSQLAVKVEGVIQHGRFPGLFRSVNKIIVSLVITPIARTTTNTVEKVQELQPSTMTQEVIPHKDFFTSQFLVSLGQGSGQATITVEAAIVDHDGNQWKSGQTSCLTVKQHDDRSH